MLLKNIFFRELVANASKILVVLIIILPVTELFKLLNQAASGHIPTVTLFTFMLYGTLASFPMILNIASFLAIVITVNRYSKDHELSIWLSSGISPFKWLKLTAWFVAPLALICGLCSMVITPWAVQQSNQYAKFLVKQAAPIALSQGVFKEAKDSQDVYYIEKYSLESGNAQNLFLQYTDESNTTYNINAKAGILNEDHGILSFTLYNGTRNQLNNFSDNRIMLMQFATFKATLKQSYDPQRDKIQLNSQSYSTLDLIRQYNDEAHNRGELSWRLSIMIMTFVMGLIALPLSMQTSRVQGSLVFIFPPIIYGVYQNIIMTINAQINDNKLFSAFWTMPVHMCLILVALGLTYYKSKPNGYFLSKNK
jgi:lipopolysaccharide export system permease protein